MHNETNILMPHYKILVTGSYGQLGTALHRYLEEAFPGCTSYYDRDKCDITDLKAVKELIGEGKYTHVINCAAYTAVDAAETDAQFCHLINVEGVKNIALATEDNSTKIIHISTDYVFDGSSNRPYTEGDKVKPVNQYGATKRKGETSLLALAPDSVILRTGWLYSAYGSNFFKTMLRLAGEKKNIEVVYDQVGTPTLADDLARGIIAVIKAKTWHPGIYHFANEGVASWYDFAQSIFDIKKSIDSGFVKPVLTPVTTDLMPRPAERPAYSVLDKAKFKAMFDFVIPHWRDSLRKCMESMDKEK